MFLYPLLYFIILVYSLIYYVTILFTIINIFFLNFLIGLFFILLIIILITFFIVLLIIFIISIFCCCRHKWTRYSWRTLSWKQGQSVLSTTSKQHHSRNSYDYTKQQKTLRSLQRRGPVDEITNSEALIEIDFSRTL